MSLRVIWWIANVWLAVAAGIVVSSLWSWLNRTGSPLDGEATIAGAIGLLYSMPALAAVALLSISKQTRVFKREMIVGWFLVATLAVAVTVFEFQTGSMWATQKAVGVHSLFAYAFEIRHNLSLQPTLVS